MSHQSVGGRQGTCHWTQRSVRCRAAWTALEVAVVVFVMLTPLAYQRFAAHHDFTTYRTPQRLQTMADASAAAQVGRQADKARHSSIGSEQTGGNEAGHLIADEDSLRPADQESQSQQPARLQSVAHDLAIARWQLAAAEHYLRHYQQVKPANRFGAASSQTASSTGGPSVVRAAAWTEPSSGGKQATDQILAELTDQRNEAKRRVVILEQIAQRDTRRTSAPPALPSPKTLANHRSGKFQWPVQTILSMFVISIVAGLIAARLELHCLTSNYNNCEEVAAALSATGLPCITMVEIPNLEASVPKSFLTRVGESVRRAVRWVLGASGTIAEFLVILFVAAIAARCMVDSTWRNLFLHDPLTAIATIWQL